MAAAAGSASVSLGRGYSQMYLQVPSMASTTSLDLYVSPDGTQPYYQLRNWPNAATATIQIGTFIIAATCSSGGAVIPIPGGFQNYKVVATDSAPSGAQGFQVLCADY